MPDVNETFTLLLGSSGTNVSGDASRFSVDLPAPIVLNGTYECILRNISFPKSTANNSVFVYASFCSPSSVNNSLEPLLFRTRPIETVDPDPVYFEERSTVLSYKLVDSRVLQRVSIWIQESDGTPVPVGAGRFSVLEVLFKKIAD